ncbi:MAG: acetyl-CoA hydrolase/transferase C-terminal domain-containing protein, partial [Woeseia sp.]
SILMLPATRTKDGQPGSNIRWSYGHTTVPRHHRDIYATQYGLAATRGKTDMQTITAMLQIADARFQDELATQAKSAGKLASTYSLPGLAGQNRPEVIESLFRSEPFRSSFPDYPLGTDLTATEQKLAVALEWLDASTASTFGKARVISKALLTGGNSTNPEALARLGLGSTSGIGERLQRRLVSYALQQTGQAL